MIKLSIDHISAISHAELFLEGATDKIDSRKIIARIQNDRLKLVEIKLYIIESMTAPKLPFIEPDKNVNEQSIPKSRE